MENLMVLEIVLPVSVTVFGVAVGLAVRYCRVRAANAAAKAELTKATADKSYGTLVANVESLTVKLSVSDATIAVQSSELQTLLARHEGETQALNNEIKQGNEKRFQYALEKAPPTGLSAPSHVPSAVHSPLTPADLDKYRQVSANSSRASSRPMAMNSMGRR